MPKPTLPSLFVSFVSLAIFLAFIGVLVCGPIFAWISHQRRERIKERFSPRVARWIADYLPDDSAVLNNPGWGTGDGHAVIINADLQELSWYYMNAALSMRPPSVLECDDPDQVKTIVFIQRRPTFLGNYSGGIYISSPKVGDDLYSLYLRCGKSLPVYTSTTRVSVVGATDGKLLEVRESAPPDVKPQYINQFIRDKSEAEVYSVFKHSGTTRYTGTGFVKTEGEHIGLHVNFSEQEDSARDWLRDVFLD